ncbi:hypothetical protein MKEN_00599400 [Mycena kentingensis (nom. inval.)]|nr:hypothetical protein MKEN_00599400 [Mycena kentingensis (nom. inval.)]
MMPAAMFLRILFLASFFTAATAKTLTSGVYHLVNVEHPFSFASLDSKNRLYLPRSFSGIRDFWEITANMSTVTIQHARRELYAQVSPPAEGGPYISAGSTPASFFTNYNGTIVIPGDGGFIPDRQVDYWTVGTALGSVWTCDGPNSEVVLLPFSPDSAERQHWMFATEFDLPFLRRHFEKAAPA